MASVMGPPNGVFRGAIGPWPPFGAKNVFLTYKKLGKLGMAPLCESTSGQRVESLNCTDYPSWKSCGKTGLTPLEFIELSNCTAAPTTPLEVTELHRQPPLEVTELHRLPPSKSQNYTDYPLKKFLIPGPPFLKS